jgi:amidophosphoribosyltransferase
MDQRKVGVKIKFNTVKGVLQNRELVVVDDSIVRGTTSKQLVNLLREANPCSINLRISSPPIMYPCFYGMDFPTQSELIANKLGGDIKKIEKELEVDSLEYLSFDGLIDCTPERDERYYCTACFTGKYPIKIEEPLKKDVNEI